MKIEFDLFATNHDIHYRAAMGGLACTLDVIGDIDGVKWQVTDHKITIEYSGTFENFAEKMLNRSFPIENGILRIPGRYATIQRNVLDQEVILKTFYQSNKKRVIDKAAGFQKQSIDVDGQQSVISFSPLVKLKRSFGKKGYMDPRFIPNYTDGSSPVEIDRNDQFLLEYIKVSCEYYKYEWSKYIVVVPDVRNLSRFVRSSRSSTKKSMWVSGPYGAAIAYWLENNLNNHFRVNIGSSMSGYKVYIYDHSITDKKQWTVVQSFNVDVKKVNSKNANILDVRPLKVNDEGVILYDPMFETFAANIVADTHWYSGFLNVFMEAYPPYRKNMRWRLKNIDLEKCMDEVEISICDAVQQGWRYRSGALSERVKATGGNFLERYGKEMDAVLRDLKGAQTVYTVREWFLDLAAKTPAFRDNFTKVRDFVFCDNNWRRLQDLCYAAIGAYKSKKEDIENMDESGDCTIEPAIDL